MGHVDHGMTELAVELLQLRAQLPFHVRVDDGEGLVKEDRGDILADHAPAEADLLFGIRRQPLRPAVEHAFHVDHGRNLAHAPVDIGLIGPTIAQREGQIVVDAHGVVDDGELEHLRDVAASGLGMGHIVLAEQDLAMRRDQDARDQVQQRRLPTARRTEQRIGLAILPDMVDRGAQRIVRWHFRVRSIGMCQIIEAYRDHQAASA